MSKIVHLLTGIIALLLSLIPSLTTDSSLLLSPAAVGLFFLGLLNVQFAGFSPTAANERNHSVFLTTSVLLILAAVVQAAILLIPIETIAGQPATLASLLLALAAVTISIANSARHNRGKKPRGDISRKKASDQSIAPASGPRETGTVKWFNTSKGFGFISRDSGDDVFVHFRAIRGEGHRVLAEGQRVEFTVMMRDKGLQAEDVVRTEH